MDGIIIINKPSGLSSGNVVYKLRHILKTKKIGHAGTLDPLASGVLVIGINKATRILEYLTSDTKEYLAQITIGYDTDTYDSQGAKQTEKPVQQEIPNIDEVLAGFMGKQKQTPPIYSAIKIKGKKLYDYALKQQEIEIPERDIEIFDIKRESDIIYENQTARFQFKVSCSKGTYIRSICHDIGIQIGYPAHMSGLIRTKSGVFGIEESHTLEQVEQKKDCLISIADALRNFEQVVIPRNSEQYEQIQNGVALPNILVQNDIVLLVDEEGTALAIYELENDILKAKKVLI